MMICTEVRYVTLCKYFEDHRSKLWAKNHVEFFFFFLRILKLTSIKLVIKLNSINRKP